MKKTILLMSVFLSTLAHAGDVFDPNTYEFDGQSQEGPSVAVLYNKVQVTQGEKKSDFAHTVVFRIAFEKFTTQETVTATLSNHCKKANSNQVQDTVLGKLDFQYSDMEELFFATLPGRVGVTLDSTHTDKTVTCSQSVAVTINGAALTNSATGKTDFDFQM